MDYRTETAEATSQDHLVVVRDFFCLTMKPFAFGAAKSP